MSRLDKMRERQHGIPLVPPPLVTTTEKPPIKVTIGKPSTPPPEPPTKPAAAPGKVKPEVVGIEVIKHSCGHPGELELFPDRQDKFRDARRKKQTDKPCPACKHAAHAALQQEQANKQPKIDRRKHGVPDDFRHVPGTLISKCWDGKRWHVVLDVPGSPQFRCESQGSFPAEIRLTLEYLAWLKTQGDDHVDLPTGVLPASDRGGEMPAVR